MFDGDFSRLEERGLDIDGIISKTRISEGLTVIDFGAGIGLFTLPLADMVGSSGTVIAVDASERMIEEIKRRLGNRQNVSIVKSMELPDTQANLILVVDVLHEVDGKKDFLKKGFSLLKPGGSMVIVDWEKEDTPMGPPLAHRLSRVQVKELAGAEGNWHEIGKGHYMVEFSKDY